MAAAWTPMMTRLWLRSLVIIGTLTAHNASLSSAWASDCGTAARAAEQAAGLPTGLLGSIGHVESGGANGMAWTVDADHQGRHFASREEAEAYAGSLLDAGQQMVDLGCFQIDLFYHPDAFARWQDAFDPAANATAAAAILKDLHDRTGDWTKAISLYHSADPARGLPYRDAVLQAWGIQALDTAGPDNAPAFSDPFSILLSVRARSIPVWGPDAPINTSYRQMSKPHDPHLPAVITP